MLYDCLRKPYCIFMNEQILGNHLTGLNINFLCSFKALCASFTFCKAFIAIYLNWYHRVVSGEPLRDFLRNCGRNTILPNRPAGQVRSVFALSVLIHIWFDFLQFDVFLLSLSKISYQMHPAASFHRPKH